MSAPLLIAMPANEAMAAEIARDIGADVGGLELRKFPDGETYLRLMSDPAGRSVVVVCTLAHPDDKILPLVFTAATARELGAARIGLVSPYLAYMRQDRRFKPGEAITSRQVAWLVSESFDWLVTVDPHLHRYGSLGEIYTIPTRVVHAAPLISRWIQANVVDPLLVGPDVESEQWGSAVAADIGAPYTVLEKIRRGDRQVEIVFREPRLLRRHTPVFVDDIISTGRTMIEAVRMAMTNGAQGAVCIAVHGLFADAADETLSRLGARVITCNTVPHPTNAIDVCGRLAEPVREFVEPRGKTEPDMR